MKVLTKEEEDEHYGAVLRGGGIGGVLGLGLGLGASLILHRRWAFYQTLTLPLKTFFVTSSMTFGAIINADRYSRTFEASRNSQNLYKDRASRELAELEANMSEWDRTMQKLRENRYTIVSGGWAASMAGSLYAVSRNRYLTTSQKLVQARMYAQGLTLVLLLGTAAFEVQNSRNNGEETVRIVDPNDPEHKRIIEKKIHHEAYAGEDLWKDMVEAEERRIAARKEATKNAQR